MAVWREVFRKIIKTSKRVFHLIILQRLMTLLNVSQTQRTILKWTVETDAFFSRKLIDQILCLLDTHSIRSGNVFSFEFYFEAIKICYSITFFLQL